MKISRALLLLLIVLCSFTMVQAQPAQTWQTGQTTPYAIGDDGDLQRGVSWPSPRFEDNSDGTVTDHLTGLIWLKNANCGGSMNWNDALTYCNNLASGSCGLTDVSVASEWRLPNRKELLSLVDYSRSFPALPQGHLFDSVQSSKYWSATTSANDTCYAWLLYINVGYVSYDCYKSSNLYYVWPVRGGQGGATNQPPTAPVLLSPADGETGIDPSNVVLEWNPSTDPDGDAVEYCVTVNEDAEPDDIPVFTGCDDEIFTSEISFTLPIPLEAGKTYWWAVWARDDQYNWSGASEWWNFKTEGIIKPNTALVNQSFGDDLVKKYKFTLSENSKIAILSAGGLDLKGVLYDEYGNAVFDLDGNRECSGYTDIGTCVYNKKKKKCVYTGHTQTNFMLRSDLEAGEYSLEVIPEDNTVSTEGEFAIVFLKHPSNSTEFFAGMNALIDDEDISNDYLDVYVKALYQEYYKTVDTLETSNYGKTICFDNICRERQCKALNNFYLYNILGAKTMFDDDTIRQNWIKFKDKNSDCVVDYDFVLKGNADLIYHSSEEFGSEECDQGKYFYNPETEEIFRGSEYNLGDFIDQGDIFVEKLTNFNHYGLIYNNTTVLDANYSDPTDGRLRKADISERKTNKWKVVRPIVTEE